MEHWSVDLRLRFSPRRRIVPLRAGGQPVGLTGRLPARRAYSSEKQTGGCAFSEAGGELLLTVQSVSKKSVSSQSGASSHFPTTQDRNVLHEPALRLWDPFGK